MYRISKTGLSKMKQINGLKQTKVKNTLETWATLSEGETEL